MIWASRAPLIGPSAALANCLKRIWPSLALASSAFFAAGAEQPPEHVAGLAPSATAPVTFVAPLCAPGSTLRFELDAEDTVEESSESDDVVERACPFG